MMGARGSIHYLLSLLGWPPLWKEHVLHWLPEFSSGNKSQVSFTGNFLKTCPLFVLLPFHVSCPSPLLVLPGITSQISYLHCSLFMALFQRQPKGQAFFTSESTKLWFFMSCTSCLPLLNNWMSSFQLIKFLTTSLMLFLPNSHIWSITNNPISSNFKTYLHIS